MDEVRLVAPRRVWVAADQVYAEGARGETFVMTAEVALRMSRLLGLAGSTAIMNRTGSRDDIREGVIDTP